MTKAQKYKEYYRSARLRRNLFFKLKDYSIYPKADISYNRRPDDLYLDLMAENHVIAYQNKQSLPTVNQLITYRHGQMLEWGGWKKYFDYIYKPQFLRIVKEIYG